MINSISHYYLDELEGWKDSIDFYFEETEELKDLLEEILQLDTVPNLAESVDYYLGQLSSVQDKLLSIKTAMRPLVKKLSSDPSLAHSQPLTEEQRKNQKETRSNMHRMEKEYVDIKYACQEFIAQVIDKQTK